jgi:hypothetical protein
MTREEMKAELTSLNIEFKDNAPTAKLEELLGITVEPIVEERTNLRVAVPVNDKATKRANIIKSARKRSLVVVYNNDKRNSEDTECFSSVRNSYFGDAKVIPIGVEWWVAQMHIDNLKSVEYTSFIKDKEGNASAKSAKKYTIDILDTDEEAYKAKLEKKNKS